MGQHEAHNSSQGESVFLTRWDHLSIRCGHNRVYGLGSIKAPVHGFNLDLPLKPCLGDLWLILTSLHPRQFAMTPEDQAALEATIVTACTAHKTANWRDHKNYRACISIGTSYFVKFDNIKSLEPEVATQRYISAYAEAHPELPGTPRIPKVLFSFQREWTMYMVMEYIHLAESPPDLEKRADALIWLSKVPPPPNHLLGPLGGGRIRHQFFKDYKAPLHFSSVEALERFIERVRSCSSSMHL